MKLLSEVNENRVSTKGKSPLYKIVDRTANMLTNKRSNRHTAQQTGYSYRQLTNRKAGKLTDYLTDSQIDQYIQIEKPMCPTYQKTGVPNN